MGGGEKGRKAGYDLDYGVGGLNISAFLPAYLLSITKAEPWLQPLLAESRKFLGSCGRKMSSLPDEASGCAQASR